MTDRVVRKKFTNRGDGSSNYHVDKPNLYDIRKDGKFKEYAEKTKQDLRYVRKKNGHLGIYNRFNIISNTPALV
jgi:hypothetical protein